MYKCTHIFFLFFLSPSSSLGRSICILARLYYNNYRIPMSILLLRIARRIPMKYTWRVNTRSLIFNPRSNAEVRWSIYIFFLLSTLYCVNQCFSWSLILHCERRKMLQNIQICEKLTLCPKLYLFFDKNNGERERENKIQFLALKYHTVVTALCLTDVIFPPPSRFWYLCWRYQAWQSVYRNKIYDTVISF